MSETAPVGLKISAGWILACIGLPFVMVGLRDSPFISVHAPAAFLGVALGLVAWLVVLASRGYRIFSVPLIVAYVITALFAFYIRQPIVEMTSSSPLALVAGAVAIFLYCLIRTRGLRHPA